MTRNQKRSKTQIGIVKRHPDGFGFFVPETKGDPDVYIPKNFMQGAMTNDKVEVEVYPEPGGNRFRGEITKILTRAFVQVIGKYTELNTQEGMLFDTNNNWGANLLIRAEDAKTAKTDDLVIVQILTYPSNKEPFSGKVIEVLGDANDPQYDTKRVIINHKIPHIFPEAVEQESHEFSPDVDPKSFPKRKDLTKMPLITIDGKTAKDFDDAIFVETTPRGFHLVVAIADVSHYVKIGSAIDTEAYQRGTSVYFPNFVVPMLPEVLSNELCSLKPHVPRLCLVADMQMDFQGNVTDADFYEAVMNSHARVTYGEAQEVIDGEGDPKFNAVKDVILKAADLAKILMARRFQHGSLDLEIPETEIIVNELGQPVDILRAERIFAHRLIEEMMLSANVAVAHFINQKGKPVLFRIHEPPKSDNIELLNRFLASFGSSHQLDSKKLQKDISRALQEFHGKPQEIILNILTLRSMNQAKYSPENVGHFGLGFDEYSHFTSPIRRYPDLIVHRVLKNVIGIPGYEMPSEGTLASAGTFLSACEQRSVKAERQLHSIKKARFIEKYVGEEFDGIISSVAKFGVFVLLRQFDVDGLVKIEDLGDDHFMFIEEKLMLKGKRSGKEYSIGDVVKIQVASCDAEAGKIDFVFPDLLPTPGILRKQHRGQEGRNQRPGRNQQNNRRDEKPNRDRNEKRGDDRHPKREDHKKHLNKLKNNFQQKPFVKPAEKNEPALNENDNSRRSKILRMLDEGVSRGHDQKRGKDENNRERPGKTRFSKRPGKGKTR